jgi:hypothetical protein
MPQGLDAQHRGEKPNRIFGGAKDDGDRRGCSLGRERGRRVTCNDHCDLSTNQFGRQHRETIALIVGPAILDGHVLALNIADVFEALAESAQAFSQRFKR